MVGTRTKNKSTHPAAPVMTDAARIKAGIPPAKRRTKKMTKDEQIRELQARLAATEYPDEATVVSKDPLVSHGPSNLFQSYDPCSPLVTTQFTRDGSPLEDVDPSAVESETPTEVDPDEFVVSGGKRASSSSHNPR